MMKKCFLALFYTLIGHFSFSAIANDPKDDFYFNGKSMESYDPANVSDINLLPPTLISVVILSPLLVTLMFSPKYVGKPFKKSWKWWLSLLGSMGLIVAFYCYIRYTTPITG
tara:strand:+ start:605 stop:940 length:336 start_codon:yes stop_codon:yes gene_type:complete